MGGKKNNTILKLLNRSEQDKATFDADWDSPVFLFTLTLNTWLCLLLKGMGLLAALLEVEELFSGETLFCPTAVLEKSWNLTVEQVWDERGSRQENWHLFTEAGHKIIQVCSLPLQHESSLVSYRHTKSQILSISWTVKLLLAENQKNKCWAQKIDFQSSSWSTRCGLFGIRHSTSRNFPSPSLQ